MSRGITLKIEESFFVFLIGLSIGCLGTSLLWTAQQ